MRMASHSVFVRQEQETLQHTSVCVLSMVYIYLTCVILVSVILKGYVSDFDEKL